MCCVFHLHLLSFRRIAALGTFDLEVLENMRTSDFFHPGPTQYSF